MVLESDIFSQEKHFAIVWKQIVSKRYMDPVDIK